MNTITTRPAALNTDDAARYISASPRTLQALVAQGKVKPPRKISAGRVAFLTRELDEFLEAAPVSDLKPVRQADQTAE